MVGMTSGQYFSGIIMAFSETVSLHEVEALCMELGVPTAPGELERYPVLLFNRLIEEGGRRFWPGEPIERVFERHGRRAFSIFAQSLIGQVGLSLAGDDVKKLAARCPRYYSAVNNYGSVEYVDTGEKKYKLEFRNFLTSPHYHHSLIEAATHVAEPEALVKLNIIKLEQPEPYSFQADFDVLIELP